MFFITSLQARELFIDSNQQTFFFLGGDNVSKNEEIKNSQLLRFLNLDLDKVVRKNISDLNKIDELNGSLMSEIIVDHNLYFEIKGDTWSAILNRSNLKINLEDQNKQLDIKLKNNRSKEVGNYRFQYMFLSENEKIYGVIYMRDRNMRVDGESFDVFITVGNSLYTGFAVLKK